MNSLRTAYMAGDLSPTDLISFHRRAFGCARMEVPTPTPPATPPADSPAPDRPDGVSDDEWAALGDPGKRAIVRERARAAKAEQEAAALRASRVPDKEDDPPKGDDDPKDIAAIVSQAVAAAFKPFEQAQAQRAADAAAQAIASSLTTAASTVLLDASDALTNIDLTSLTDGAGQPDPTKIKTALDDLVQRKPHLARVVDARRRPGDSSMLGGAPTSILSQDDQVKAALAKMQQSAGIKLATV